MSNQEVHPEEKPVLRFDPILDLAMQNGIIDEEQALSIQDEHENSGKATRDLIIELGYLTEDDLLNLIAGYMGTEIIDLAHTDIPAEVRNAIPAAIARATLSSQSKSGSTALPLPPRRSSTPRQPTSWPSSFPRMSA